jgi:CoA:oxalate CoA-transferase
MSRAFLEGTRVLDLSTHVAGPFCTKLLAGMGAEVVKLERPEKGDVSRRFDTFGNPVERRPSDLFIYLNTNKRSVTVDLRSDTGQAILDDLVRWAEIVVESYRPATAEQLGVTWERISATKPAQVLTTISGFASNGPYRNYASDYLSTMALSGFPHQIGEEGHEPLVTGQYFGLYVAGLTAAVQAVGAVLGRNLGGPGCHIEVPVTHALNWIQPAPLAQLTLLGYSSWPRNANALPGVIKCLNGFIGINVLTYQQWQRLCYLVDRADLAERPDFQNRKIRNGLKEEWMPAFTSWAADKTKEEILALGQELRIPFAIVSDVASMLEMEQHRERGFFSAVELGADKTVTMPGCPMISAESPWQSPSRAPELGEHNQEVLGGWLGRQTGTSRQQGSVGGTRR